MHTNFGKKMKWVEAAYNRIHEVNVDGQPLHQHDTEHPNIMMHQLDSHNPELRVVPDSDFEDIVMNIPPVQTRADDDIATSRGTLERPPPIDSVVYPFCCPCEQRIESEVELIHHWMFSCSKYSTIQSPSTSQVNGQQTPRHPGSNSTPGEATYNGDGDAAVQPLPGSNPNEAIEMMIATEPVDRLQRVVSSAPGTVVMDVVDDDSSSTHSNVQSAVGKAKRKRRNSRQRAAANRQDPLNQGDIMTGKRPRSDLSKGHKKQRRTTKEVAVKKSPFSDDLRFIRVPLRRKKEKVRNTNKNTTNPYSRVYNTRDRSQLAANHCLFHAFSAIYSPEDQTSIRKKRKPYIYDEMTPPRNIDEIQNRPDQALWYGAIRTELAKHVGTVVDNDPNRIPTFHKINLDDNYDPSNDKRYHLVWRFDIKTKYNPQTKKLEITKRKCRVAIDGSTDVEDIDFDSRYGSSKVVNATTTRLLLSMAARYKLKASQFDVAGAYLYGILPKERRVFIRAPILIDDPQLGVQGIAPGDLCRVDTALYGLPDSSGIWAEKLLTEIKNINAKLGTNFEQLAEDPCVLVHRRVRGNGQDDELILIPIYVDDLRCYYNNDKLYSAVLSELHKVFELDDRTHDEVYLGMSVKRDGLHGAFHLNCETLITKIIEKNGLDNVQERSIPMVDRSPSTNNQIKLTKEKYKQFRSILGAISFVAYSCRPDISFATNKISRHQSSPDLRDWDDLMYLIGYLKATKAKGIVITGKWNHLTSSNFTIYTDASFGDVTETLHSSYGYAAYLGSDLIYWTSTTTKSVCRSSAESELYAIDKAVLNTVIPVNKLLSELKIASIYPPMIRCDNQAAIDVINSDKYVKRLKHTRIQIAFLRQEKQGYIDEDTNIRERPSFDTKHIGTKENGADIFTKILSPSVFPITRSLVFYNTWSDNIY